MIYDYIIVGAGIGGLSAGLNLAKNGKKVLILEQNSLPGGLVSTFRRGRFEFDTSMYNLYNYGDEKHFGKLKKYFEDFNIEVHPVDVPLNNRIKSNDENIDLEIKGGVEEWFIALEKQTPKSIDSLKKFLPIIKEVHDTLEKLANNEEVLETESPNFYKYLKYNASESLKDLGIPKTTINLLGSFWVDLESPLNKLSFIDFSEKLYQMIFEKNVALKEKNLNFVFKLVKAFESFGGKIYYRSKVTNIKYEDNLGIVTLENKSEFKANEIICNLSNRYVLLNLLNRDYPEFNELENARTIAPTNFVVFLGLNKNANDLGLNNYRYDYFTTINSEKNVSTMVTNKNNTITAYVPNIVNELASPRNTSILVLKTTFFDDLFKNKEDYHKLKEIIAHDLIKKFEEAFNIDIEEYIEEIEIATPLTILKHSSTNYIPLGYDNVINRFLSYDEEQIDGIHIVGASHLGIGVDTAFLSGIMVTNELLNRRDN